MKVLSIVCALLLCIAFVSANPTTTSSSLICKYGEINYTKGSFVSCIPWYSCHDITMQQSVVTQYTDSVTGQVYTQYNVVITNHLGMKVKNVVIGSDATLALRDSSSIWNMQLLSNGNLILSSYQPSIDSNASYTFGFILKGTQKPNLYIKSVVY